MLTVFGDILNWLAAGVLFPLLALPLASLGKTRRAAAAIWFALIGAIIGGAMAFANLAADLAAPKWTPALALAVIGGVGVAIVIGGLLMLALGFVDDRVYDRLDLERLKMVDVLIEVPKASRKERRQVQKAVKARVKAKPAPKG